MISVMSLDVQTQQANRSSFFEAALPISCSIDLWLIQKMMFFVGEIGDLAKVEIADSELLLLIKKRSCACVRNWALRLLIMPLNEACRKKPLTSIHDFFFFSWIRFDELLRPSARFQRGWNPLNFSIKCQNHPMRQLLPTLENGDLKLQLRLLHLHHCWD